MGKFSLEQKIKDRLKGHEVHIDKGELWKGLGIEDEREDRKAIWFWWTAGIIGIILVAGLLWFVISGIENGSDQEISSFTEVNERIGKNDGENTIAESKIDKSSTFAEENQNGIIFNEENLVATNTSSFAKPKLSKPIAENNFTIQNTTPTQNSKISENPTDQNIFSNVSDGKSENENVKNVESITSKQILNIPFLENLLFDLEYERSFEVLDDEIDPFIKPIAYADRYEIEVFGGIGNVDRSLSFIRDEADGYLTIRDTSEKLLEHAAFGFSFKRQLGGGFYGKAGLTYNRWNERFSYVEKSDSVLSIQEVPDVILFDLAGNEIITFTEGEVISYNNINWIRYNRLTQIDLPVTIGYERVVNRWSLFGEASAIINLSQSFSGFMYNRDLEIVENPENFKSRIGINLGLNTGLGYGITPRLRARLSVRYYKSLGSVLTSENGIDQKYASLGLRLGIGYQF